MVHNAKLLVIRLRFKCRISKLSLITQRKSGQAQNRTTKENALHLSLLAFLFNDMLACGATKKKQWKWYKMGDCIICDKNDKNVSTHKQNNDDDNNNSNVKNPNHCHSEYTFITATLFNGKASFIKGKKWRKFRINVWIIKCKIRYENGTQWWNGVCNIYVSM